MCWFSHRRSPSPLGGYAMVSSVAACCVPPTEHALSYYALSMSWLSCFFFILFVPGDLGLLPMALIFEVGRDFCIMYLITKFYRPTFSRSQVVVRTNKQTHWQTNRRRWNHPPRSTMLRRWVKKLVKDGLLETRVNWSRFFQLHSSDCTVSISVDTMMLRPHALILDLERKVQDQELTESKAEYTSSKMQ